MLILQVSKWRGLYIKCASFLSTQVRKIIRRDLVLKSIFNGPLLHLGADVLETVDEYFKDSLKYLSLPLI